MVCNNCGYCAGRDGLRSDYKDPRNGEMNIPMFPLSQLPHGSICNNVDVKISTSQKLTLRKLIICLALLVQLVGSVVLMGILYIRICQLEVETRQLIAQASVKISELVEFRQQINEDILQWRDTRTTKSNLEVINASENTETSESPNNVETDHNKDNSNEIHKDEVWKAVQGTRENQNDNDRGTSNGKTDGNKFKSEQIRKNRQDNSSSDISWTHFKGVLREICVKDKGTIGPWYIDDSSSKSMESKDLNLILEKSSVKVLTEGYYFVYAQVYYQSPNGSSSFSIVKRRFPGHEEDQDEVLATCSGSSGSSIGHEVSCFTATVAKLGTGDKLSIIQREVDRHILFREGQSYFGIIKLSTNPQFSLG